MGKVAVIGGVTCLFTITALALIAYHAQPHCSVSSGDNSESGCTDEFKKECDRAYAVRIEQDLSGTEVVYKYSCPWNPETAALGLIGLVLVQICLVVLIFVMKGKNLKTVMMALTALIVPILLATFCLMIRDLKWGYDLKEEEGLKEGWRPGTFIANIILLFFGLCLFSTAAFLGHRHTTKN